MKRRDRQRWAAARTLPQLGELVALWLEGKIPSQPGYQPNCGPDPETLPLMPTLAAINRAGFVTCSSQPGFDGPGFDGAHWQQRAAVEGFVTEEAGRLCELVSAQPELGLRVHLVANETDYIGEPVTRREGEPYTWFGHRLDHGAVADLYDVCSREMVTLLYAAVQVTVFDREWGRDSVLWPVLQEFADTA